jgi:Nucleotidyltransferase of unknown function (DUF6036)
MQEPARDLVISERADPAYVAAFRTLASRVARSANATVDAPITMFLAGGAAMHFYTGARMTDDIDAVFDRKILVPANATVIYRDAEGKARSVYFDVNYNESYALLHEDAHDDAWRLVIDGLDAVRVLVLQPVDLAVSKLARFSEIDRGDILQLAKDGLIAAAALQQRAADALPGYVGSMAPLQTSIMLACRDIEALGAK